MRVNLAALALALIAAPAAAALPVGAKAPNFATQGAIGGKPFKLVLAGSSAETDAIVDGSEPDAIA